MIIHPDSLHHRAEGSAFSKDLADSTRQASTALVNDGVYHPGASASNSNSGDRVAAATNRQLEFTPIANYDRPKQQNLADVAAGFEGQKLWAKSKYRKDMDNGKLGCTASESLVLQAGGYKYADAEAVGQLYNQLTQHGWKAVANPNDRQPGDVMIAYKAGTNWKVGGGNAHVGTVAEDGNIWNNSARKGETWQKEPPNVAFGDYNRYIVLRPPAR